MKLSFRWYGKEDKVTLENIRQIPGMHSIVTAVYDVPVGEVWSRESIAELKKQTEEAGLHFEVIESAILPTTVKISKDLQRQASNVSAITLCPSLTGPGHSLTMCCRTALPPLYTTRSR